MSTLTDSRGSSHSIPFLASDAVPMDLESQTEERSWIHKNKKSLIITATVILAIASVATGTAAFTAHGISSNSLQMKNLTVLTGDAPPATSVHGTSSKSLQMKNLTVLNGNAPPATPVTTNANNSPTATSVITPATSVTNHANSPPATPVITSTRSVTTNANDSPTATSVITPATSVTNHANSPPATPVITSTRSVTANANDSPTATPVITSTRSVTNHANSPPATPVITSTRSVTNHANSPSATPVITSTRAVTTPLTFQGSSSCDSDSFKQLQEKLGRCERAVGRASKGTSFPWIELQKCADLKKYLLNIPGHCKTITLKLKDSVIAISKKSACILADGSIHRARLHLLLVPQGSHHNAQHPQRLADRHISMARDRLKQCPGGIKALQYLEREISEGVFDFIGTTSTINSIGTTSTTL